MTHDRNQNGSGGGRHETGPANKPGRAGKASGNQSGRFAETPGDDSRGSADDRVEEILRDLHSVDLPPFYRTRLLAKIRAASERPAWRERLREPALAWSVAGACVIALVLVVVYTGRTPSPSTPIAPGIQIAAASIDPVMPADNSVVGAGDVEIVAAIYPPIEGGIVRLYVDERDVTGLAEVTESYVMYSPVERLEEGEHIVTIEITDGSGLKLKDASWLFYTLNGREPSFDPRT